MPVSNAEVDQILCAYDPDNPTENTGFGPVASSLPTLAEVSLFKLAGAVLRPPGDSTAGNSIAYERLSSDQDLIVRRVVAIDPLNRENLLSQALIAGRGRLTAELALGLDQADWPLGDDITRVQLGDRLSRPNLAELDRLGRAGADRLRELSRGPALTEALCQLTAWVLTDPLSRLSVAASQVGGDPRAALLGLVDMLSVLVPGRWTFSTQESAESDAYRLIVMPEWPRPGSPDYGRLRLGGQPAPDGAAHTAASLLVTRYQTYGLAGLELLRRQQGWHRMSALDRAETLRNLLTLHAETTPHKELPPAPDPSPLAASQEYAIEGVEELTGLVESQASQATESPGTQESPTPESSTASFDPAPALLTPTHSAGDPPVDVSDAALRDREAAALVERLFQARSAEEGRELLMEVSSRAELWSESQTEIACLTAIRYRLGLKYRRTRGQSCQPVFTHDPQQLFDLLIRTALYRRDPAIEWAVFLRQEYVAVLTDPLRSVVREMFEQDARRELVVHHAFFVVVGRWAGPVALHLDLPGNVPPVPSGPPAVPTRFKPSAWLRGRRRDGGAGAPHRAQVVPPAQPEGNTADFVLLGKVVGTFVIIVLVLLGVGTILRNLP
ncbi:putative membrane protein [Streptomyces davaonensis JCM 4913]|uniref:Putative membrane protein n=1 Tax=Streptomyces davaonensis (strain DSM 101723 / JCM 4913 / KCC S-0913 / 768) TaxID=1214101 RepID=K4QZV3_STRDJ|nr:hypothetical protein [Streptomyces davaonensis]CCK26437.1 putative membrane protein [Streptomyces davaonensis JCM 4913]